MYSTVPEHRSATTTPPQVRIVSRGSRIKEEGLVSYLRNHPANIAPYTNSTNLRCCRTSRPTPCDQTLYHSRHRASYEVLHPSPRRQLGKPPRTADKCDSSRPNAALHLQNSRPTRPTTMRANNHHTLQTPLFALLSLPLVFVRLTTYL